MGTDGHVAALMLHARSAAGLPDTNSEKRHILPDQTPLLSAWSTGVFQRIWGLWYTAPASGLVLVATHVCDQHPQGSTTPPTLHPRSQG